MSRLKNILEMIEIVADILEESGESFLNDEGVDRQVCTEVAAAIVSEFANKMDCNACIEHSDYEHV